VRAGAVAGDADAGALLVGRRRAVRFVDPFLRERLQFWDVVADVGAGGVPFFAEGDGAVACVKRGGVSWWVWYAGKGKGDTDSGSIG
jgi:hypothetical protein